MSVSIFDNAREWPDKYKACGAPHQSPINLSQSFADPCERLCEWKVDDTAVGMASVSDMESQIGGLVLNAFQNGKPTATFNGDGYTCEAMVLYSTSQHSLEGIFGEGELVCYFTHPGGKIVCMSVIVRITPGETASSKFFNAFVPYAENGGTINLGSSWSLLDVIPDTPSYYIYTGTTIWPDCRPNITWIVYSNTVNMDPSDYAKLSRVIKPARRPLEEVADRVVTFFDAKGVSTPRDGKLYMRCRRIGKKKEGEGEGGPNPNKPVVQPGGLDNAVSEEEKEKNQMMMDNAVAAASAQYESMGGVYGILTVLVLAVTSGGLFYTSTGKQVGATAFVIAFIVPHYIRAFVMMIIAMIASA
jgi:carbonic anhydrase